jgi:hypothetical protein
VFSHQEINHFRAFGFVVLRGLLDAAEVAQLRAEVTTELNAAFGGLGTDPGETGGISGDYLPLAVDRAPLSQALIADDARLFQGAADLYAAMMVASPGLAICFTGSVTGWHTDQGPDVGGVNFLVHLEPRTAETGALRVIPGSHDPGFARRLESYWACDPGRQGFAPWPTPDVVLETEPGDVIAFDPHLHHASTSGGRKRLAWKIEYLPWPGLGDPAKLEVVRDLVVDGVEYDDYDRDRWPVWREWVAGAAAVPSRQLAVDRLRLLGVLGDGDPR